MSPLSQMPPDLFSGAHRLFGLLIVHYGGMQTALPQFGIALRLKFFGCSCVAAGILVPRGGTRTRLAPGGSQKASLGRLVFPKASARWLAFVSKSVRARGLCAVGFGLIGLAAAHYLANVAWRAFCF